MYNLLFGTKEKTIYVDANEFAELQKQYGENPQAIRVTNTIIGEAKTLMVFKLKK